MYKPFLWLCVGSILGVLVACYGFRYTPFFLILALFAMIVGSWLFFQYRQGLVLTLLLFGLALGALRFTDMESRNHSTMAPLLPKVEESVGVKNVRVNGDIASSPQVDGDRLTCDLVVRQLQIGKQRWVIPREKVRINIRLLSRQERQQAKSLERFDSIVTSLTLKRPPVPRNPGAFDYRTYLYHQQIHYLADVQGLHLVQVKTKSHYHPFVWIDRLRHFLSDQIGKLYIAEYAGFARGLLIGERSEVNPDLIREYSMLGIIHLLVIAGLHVSVLVGFLYFLLKAIGLTRERAALCLLLVLPLYVILTGAGVPVVRAAIMAGLGFIAILLRRWKDTLSFLSIALLIQLFWNPYQLFEAGFQLSYSVTAALVVGAGPLARKLAPYLRGKGLSEIIATTTVAQMASLPILIYHFHEFSLLSGIANLFAVPIVSLVVLPLSWVALLVGLLWQFLGQAFATVTTWLLDFVQWGVKGLLAFSFAHVTWSPPSVFWIALYTTALIYCWLTWTGDGFRFRLHRIVSTLALLGVLLYAYLLPLLRHEMVVTFLDVGQGDCTVIETAKGKVIMVDGGGTPSFNKEPWQRKRNPYEVGERVVLPYLKYRGIRQIDELILTHGDMDHIGGVQAVANRFPIKRVIRNPHPPHTDVERKLMATLKEKGAQICCVPNGYSWEVEPGVYWKFVNPDPRHLLGSPERSNDDSVVFLLWIYHHKILMTGDIGEKAEKAILSHWKLPHIQILKVGHHGSKSSTHEEWLKVLKPQDAVISVGANNRYGHPAKEALERLEAYHAHVLRTDQVGAITYLFTPKEVKVKTMLHP